MYFFDDFELHKRCGQGGIVNSFHVIDNSSFRYSGQYNRGHFGILEFDESKKCVFDHDSKKGHKFFKFAHLVRFSICFLKVKPAFANS